MVAPGGRARTAEYREYCRCWWVYLQNINRSPEFAFLIRCELPWITEVVRWPMVAPEVVAMFTPTDGKPEEGVRRFVEAVRQAEATLKPLPSATNTRRTT